MKKGESGLRIAIIVSDVNYDLADLIQAQQNHSDLFSIKQVLTNKLELFEKLQETVKSEKFIPFTSDIQICLIGFEKNNEPFNRQDLNYHVKLSSQILEIVRNAQIDIILLDGFYVILKNPLVQVYEGRILNVHPSLLPKFNGKGMYGMNVHQAVIESKETETGATIYLVDLGIDTGEILTKAQVHVGSSDTPETLYTKVRYARIDAIIHAIEIIKQRMM